MRRSTKGMRIGPVCIDCGGEKYAPRAMRCGPCAKRKVRAAQSEHKKVNAEEIAEARRARYIPVGEPGFTSTRESSLLWRRQNAERVLWHSARRRAKLNGWAFDITPSDIYIPHVCPVFGFPLQRPPAPPNGRPDNLASLDRIDSKQGYVRGNIWVVSWRANRLKNDASVAELEQLCAALRARAA